MTTTPCCEKCKRWKLRDFNSPKEDFCAASCCECHNDEQPTQSMDERFWLRWGIAPEGTKKADKGWDTLNFIQSEIALARSAAFEEVRGILKKLRSECPYEHKSEGRHGTFCSDCSAESGYIEALCNLDDEIVKKANK